MLNQLLILVPHVFRNSVHLFFVFFFFVSRLDAYGYGSHQFLRILEKKCDGSSGTIKSTKKQVEKAKV